MACIDMGQTQNVRNQTDSIQALLKKIAAMQKDAIAQAEANECNTCILAPIYNTIPVAVYICNQPLTAEYDKKETNRFRVETVNNDIVILRLIDTTGNEDTCTNYTISCKISCICCVQCFGAITCAIDCVLAQ